MLANALSHLCRLIHKFSLATHYLPLPAPLLPSPVNFKFLRHIYSWIVPLDSSVDNHFCMIDISISLCTWSLSTIQQTQWQIYSGGYTVADRQQWIQRQIYSTGSRYTFTGADTQGWIHSGRYTMAKTIADIQHSTHSGTYTAADTLWQIQNGGYAEVNIQQWIYRCRYSIGYTTQQTQWLIYSGRYGGRYIIQ